MSYLNPPRLHFAGRFQAAPSTVNNDPVHFDNATFVPAFQSMQDKTGWNGWWNPNGDAAWRLIRCKVTAAWISHEQQASSGDPIVSCLVGDSDRAPPAKIVDLDPEQQMVSEIWGMQVRICLADGANLLRARYETAAFSDIWDRSAGGGGDSGGGAMYQSVLTDLEWGDISSSPFLTALKRSSQNEKLSIKFNVDGYNMDSKSSEFMRGRIVGTIGPYLAGEPDHFVVGRHFMAAAGPNGNFFAPAGKVNFCSAVLDQQAGKIILDLGNALSTDQPGSALSDLGTLGLGYLAPATTRNGGSAAIMFDRVTTTDYTSGGWYETTAGVVTLPTHRTLSQFELTAIGQNPLALTATGADGNTKVAIAEAPNGTYVRADRFVFRLNPGDTAKVRLVASQWGQPYGGARIIASFDPLQLQAQASSPLGVAAPQVAQPIAAIEFPARVIADQNGAAELAICVSDPKQIRDYIDGQIYGVRPILEDDLGFGAGYNLNPWEFVSLLVWSGFAEENPPTWYGSIQPIFQQYANLFPVMKRIVDLAGYDSVCANVRMLLLAFGLPVDDPNSMPVTRDLSAAKRKAILRWLSEPGPDGKPLKGTAPPPAPAAAAVAQHVATPTVPDDAPLRGGKTAAASRRLMFRNRSG
jgi:hypothetical protein